MEGRILSIHIFAPIWFLYTAPKTNECPLKRDHFKKERIVFQPYFLGGHVSFQGV